MKRMSLVLVVWLGCGLAWVVLGTSLVARTGEWSGDLKPQVQKLWGPPLEQGPPSASYGVKHEVQTTVTRRDAAGRTIEVPGTKVVQESVAVPIEASDLQVRLALEHRRKGLLWFPTYGVDFSGRYAFVNPSAELKLLTIVLPLAGENTVYDGFEVRDGSGIPCEADFRGGSAVWKARLAPHERREFTVKYGSRGTSTWKYRPTEGTSRVKNFRLAVTTNFGNVDFPPGSISPSSHARERGGWRGEWSFQSLVANAPVGILLPERLNPGPLAARITFFAPVGLLFYFFVLAMVAHARGQSLHPMNYFFIGCAFFAFHLLFAYLVDHLSIGPSFAIASATSILLVLTYARLFTGWGFALRLMGPAQLLYLVLFSYTFFWEGFTGLAITIGAILTLFVMMQYTGRVGWDQPQLRRAA
ncbi:MAG TPA: inner membrane CreD family protein [Candidatus Eisenbacteria bacterium]|jgi:hypothetical protein